jgi:hypothetical protein
MCPVERISQYRIKQKLTKYYPFYGPQKAKT